jgi:deferrochelatase/peroxidase EfeB
VDIVVQLRTRAAGRVADGHRIIGNQAHPLWGRVQELAGKAGVRLLSVEPMLRYANAANEPTGHIDFVDGISQPAVKGVSGEPPQKKWDNAVNMGEILSGYANDRNDGPIPAQPDEYLDNGTFLVVRKLGLDIGALEAFYAEQAAKAGIAKRELQGKMMGRYPDGETLAEPGNKGNDFNYDDAGNKSGARCPFQSHARRANPRTSGPGKARVPRIMRRGMSYGP